MDSKQVSKNWLQYVRVKFTTEFFTYPTVSVSWPQSHITEKETGIYLFIKMFLTCLLYLWSAWTRTNLKNNLFPEHTQNNIKYLQLVKKKFFIEFFIFV